MDTTISATELSRRVSDILNRVKYKGERFVVRRNGEDIAILLPLRDKPGITVSEFIARAGDLKLHDDGFADNLEAVQAEQGLAEISQWPD
jgi:prevent-host-death family protein